MANVRKGNNQVLLVGSPFHDENNNVVKVITVMRNLTELIRLKEKLEELIRQNRFRADLYNRLNVFPMKLPSLLERREDIPDLAAAFHTKFNILYSKNKSFGSSALTALMKYDWPGNVRELENIIERIVIISSRRLCTILKERY